MSWQQRESMGRVELAEDAVVWQREQAYRQIRRVLTLARFEAWLRQLGLQGQRTVGRACSGWNCPLSRFLESELGYPVFVSRLRVYLSGPPVDEEESGEDGEEAEEGLEEGVELPEWARLVVDWVDRFVVGVLTLADVQMIVGEVKQTLAARRY
ncbi:hypothetical protein [Thermogemmatispora sp.]|uniref:hypothetical protein n=1 Tax=Thermogemmatispora sp. TaxID=1968838 RepID=UPI0035E4485A